MAILASGAPAAQDQAWKASVAQNSGLLWLIYGLLYGIVMAYYYNFGLLWLIFGLLYGIVACYLRLLGVPGRLEIPVLQPWYVQKHRGVGRLSSAAPSMPAPSSPRRLPAMSRCSRRSCSHLGASSMAGWRYLYFCSFIFMFLHINIILHGIFICLYVHT